MSLGRLQNAIESGSFRDLVGTSSAERSLHSSANDLYELAGLADDRERWTILGVDLLTFSHGREPDWTVRVYALDRKSSEFPAGLEGFDQLRELERERGGYLPVTEILLHDVGLNDVVKCMKVVHIQLLAANFQHLEVVKECDLPSQV